MNASEADSHNPTSRLAAIVFDRQDDVDTIVAAFVARLGAQGLRVGGLLQQAQDDDVFVRDLDTDELLPIMQDLGAAAEGCAVDPAQIAIAARMLDAARLGKPDLLVVNRFGRLESEGGGMLAEIGAAVAEGETVLIAVPLRFLDAWNAFAAGFDAQIAPRAAALDEWWRAAAATATAAV